MACYVFTTTCSQILCGATTRRMKDSELVQQAFGCPSIPDSMLSAVRGVRPLEPSESPPLLKMLEGRPDNVTEKHTGSFGRVYIFDTVALKLPRLRGTKMKPLSRDDIRSNCSSVTAEAMFMVMLQRDMETQRCGLRMVFPRLEEVNHAAMKFAGDNNSSIASACAYEALQRRNSETMLVLIGPRKSRRRDLPEFSEVEAAEVLLQLALIVEQLWAKHGVLHGDLSLKNVMAQYRDNQWVVRLVDVGWSQCQPKPASCMYTMGRHAAQEGGTGAVGARSLDAMLLLEADDQEQTEEQHTMAHKRCIGASGQPYNTFEAGHLTESGTCATNRELCTFWGHYHDTYGDIMTNQEMVLPAFDDGSYQQRLLPWLAQAAELLESFIGSWGRRVCPRSSSLYAVMFETDMQRYLSEHRLGILLGVTATRRAGLIVLAEHHGESLGYAATYTRWKQTRCPAWLL